MNGIIRMRISYVRYRGEDITLTRQRSMRLPELFQIVH